MNNTHVITLVKIHNKTGATVTYFTNKDFSGALAPQSKYPAQIENGEYDLFEHEGPAGDNAGSCGAVVYSVTNKDGKASHWMLSWSNPTGENYKVFTEITGQGHYKPNPNDPIWHNVHAELSKSGTTSSSDWNGCHSSMTSIRSNDVPNRVDVDATVTLATAKA
ncbi:23 kDa jasmonate-induced protein-like [Camellia sinensis]|uniref:Uncharacterized protein n=1 Tax=Camellia sinensis var. sinensis TaxID=542762 RepID=A0A4S4EW68_CAMSN|nr:23 kDa jasmonate-induced protein-like [Camellia sinensis]THG21221.1 hypothetical protein TEA_028661 [Camellia sinensis var. sinensis]